MAPTNAYLLSTGSNGTNFSVWISEVNFSFMKMTVEMLSTKLQPFCLELNVLRTGNVYVAQPKKLEDCLTHPEQSWWLTTVWLNKNFYLRFIYWYLVVNKERVYGLVNTNQSDGVNEMSLHRLNTGFTTLTTLNTLRSRQNVRHFQTFSNAFSWMKIYEFHLRFHWSLFLRFKLIIFRCLIGAYQVTSHYLNQWWLVYWGIHASFCLNEFTHWGRDKMDSIL